MLLLTGKTLQETLRDFNLESWRVNALNYNGFLNSDFYKGHSIMDALYELQKVVEYSRKIKLNKRLTKKINIDLVLEFYKKLGLNKELEPILLGQHPMFKTVIDKTSPSQVCYKNTEDKLAFNVGETGTIEGAINLAHESAHAINGHYKQMQEFIKIQNKILKNFGKDSDEFKEHNNKIKNYIKSQSCFLQDCTCEIETHIIELLFLDFLVEKNTISLEDKQAYLKMRNNSFRNNLKTMFQEDIIYSKIIAIKKEKFSHIANIDEEEFNILCERLKSNNHYKDIMEKFYFISNRIKLNKRKIHSSYVFRYVVGEIISTVWYHLFITANQKDKQKILEDLKLFIKTNNNLNLNNSVKLLLQTDNYQNIIDLFIEISLKVQTNMGLNIN